MTSEIKLPGCEGERRLQRLVGSMERAEKFYNKQVFDHLNPRTIKFLSRQTMIFIGTMDERGYCYCALESSHSGFIRILNRKWLVLPCTDRRTLGNIRQHGYASVCAIDYLEDKVGCHVNGQAKIIERDLIAIEVEEAYIHCSKHIAKLELDPQRGTTRATRSPLEQLQTSHGIWISTADKHGETDCSYRAGERGELVHPIGERFLLIPEYRGNGVMASLGNITERPTIGICAPDFFETQTVVQVWGRAWIVENRSLVEFYRGEKSYE